VVGAGRGRRAEPARRRRVGSARTDDAEAEDTLPTYLAIILAVLVLGALVAAAFAAWRLIANLRALASSVADLNRQLNPLLEELARQGQTASERVARLQLRQIRPDGDGAEPGRTDAAG
jgi:hypothetical protein